MSSLSLNFSPSGIARRRQRRSWLSRVLTALEEARMRQARQVLARYQHLLPEELERAGDRLDARSEDQLSFRRD